MSIIAVKMANGLNLWKLKILTISQQSLLVNNLTNGVNHGKTPSSKNKPKTPFPVKAVDKKINDAYTKKEVDRLKNLVARQDDLIAQMLDEINDQKNTAEVLRDECNQLDEKIDSYREILKTLLEITE